MILTPLAGAASDRFGRLVVPRYTLGLLFVANMFVVVGGRAATIAGALLYSAGASTVPAIIAAHVRDSLDSRSFGQTLATMTMLFSIMTAAMPAIVGALADVSFAWSYLTLAALPLIALVFLQRSGAGTQST